MESKSMKKFIRYVSNMKKKQAKKVEKINKWKKLLFFNWIGFRKFERIVRFEMPFDKRSNIPGKDYGIGAMRIWFILKGSKGAVQVLIGTQFFLPATVNEYNRDRRNLLKTYDGKDQKPFECWDVGFHSISRPSYLEKSDKMSCEINDCGYCYYDGSSLRGRDDKIAQLFMEKGTDGIFDYLEKNYKETFKDKRPSGFGSMIKTLEKLWKPTTIKFKGG